MFIDKLLSRYSIRTKVLALVVPFVASISAVGVTGLYASGMLQHRMDISNDTMRALSGFRDVGEAMNTYLDATSEESRAAVVTRLQEQQADLEESLSALDAAAVGRDSLERALAETRDVTARIDEMWALFQTEESLSQALNESIKGMVSAQIKLSDEAQKMQRAVANQENDAKTAFREADRLASGASFIETVAAAYRAEVFPEQQTAVLADAMPELVKTQRRTGTALPKERAPVGKEFQAINSDLSARVKSGDVSLENIDEIRRLVLKLEAVGAELAAGAREKSALSVERFGAVDTELVKTNEILDQSRKLVSDVYDLRINVTAFLANRTEEGRSPLVRQADLIASNMETLGASIQNDALFGDLTKLVTPALAALKTDSADLVAASEKRTAGFAEAAAVIDRGWVALTEFAEAQRDAAGTEGREANTLSLGATTLGILLAIVGGVTLILTLQRPIGQITAIMRRLASGDLETSIAGEARGDEIGAMARALGVFKANARSKIEIEAEGERERARAEEERRRNDAEKQALDAEIDEAVTQLAAALERLASGDISFQIEGRFAGRLERLRTDFNLSVSRLRDTMTRITDNVGMIQNNGRQMAHSAAALSKRTEQQAASLEETAAAVEEITATVRATAGRAEEVNGVVSETKRNAEQSAVVMGDAVSAMDRIEEASRKIEQIIEVIDQIAFQTNLLALNAGVEAARAGEAGKGFAVVAQEVRELAQRSATAAKDIKVLIHGSTEEVATGAAHVKGAGEVLSRIGGQIGTISQLVEMIVTASREQSSALQEINGAVNQMDQMTQQNAAMVEEATAASHDLAGETDALVELVRQFRLQSASPVRADRAA
ncbi:HAMP domain-containing protein [Ciceribacter sp. L1K23]|uniref:methyl-accepting chemotaxis protein n=1 Tax=Ciceribacter sp. L1K23 TaxID=2820276 RepID=UPI001B8154DF|nr:HAMP domain-containing methyl-accepting chemotaxis protein [Ciceribacter sp. L1K23]MBR0556945.1 HAMP domain-containing protein [Ciceribacter sp. L1K23]